VRSCLSTQAPASDPGVELPSLGLMEAKSQGETIRRDGASRFDRDVLTGGPQFRQQ